MDNEAILKALAELSPVERADILTKVVANSSPAEKSDLAKAMGGPLPGPDASTAGRVWIIVISAFATVLVASTLALIVGLFRNLPSSGTKPELVLTVFTTVAGFFGGLFAPSPVSQKNGG